MAQQHLYLIALGSNRRHPVLGPPERILAEAFVALEMADIDVFAHSHIVSSAPVGPSTRRYVNAAAIIASPLKPPALLSRLHEIEAHFGRERRGQAWRARVLDLDIILWSGGMWIDSNPALAIPHAHMHKRDFVLGPASEIAPRWRDPITGLALKHLYARYKRRIPVPKAG